MDKDCQVVEEKLGKQCCQDMEKKKRKKCINTQYIQLKKIKQTKILPRLVSLGNAVLFKQYYNIYDKVSGLANSSVPLELFGDKILTRPLKRVLKIYQYEKNAEIEGYLFHVL